MLLLLMGNDTLRERKVKRPFNREAHFPGGSIYGK